MKKHIFGFALFSFIVGVAVAISGFLAFRAVTVNVFEIHKAPPESPRGYYCPNTKYRNYDYGNARIKQAVLDVKTKQLKTSLSAISPTETTENFTVALHFFVKNGRQTKYLATENIWMHSAFDSEKESLLTSLEWLDNLESFDNLYIVPEITDNSVSYKKNPPSFNYTTAAPVLLSRGKDF